MVFDTGQLRPVNSNELTPLFDWGHLVGSTRAVNSNTRALRSKLLIYVDTKPNKEVDDSIHNTLTISGTERRS